MARVIHIFLTVLFYILLSTCMYANEYDKCYDHPSCGDMWAQLADIQNTLQKQASRIDEQERQLNTERFRNKILIDTLQRRLEKTAHVTFNIQDRMDRLNATHIRDQTKNNQMLQQHQTVIGDNTNGIERNKNDLAALTSRVENNQLSITNNNMGINTNQQQINTNVQNINANTAKTVENAGKIEDNKDLIQDNERDINVNENRVDQLDSQVNIINNNLAIVNKTARNNSLGIADNARDINVNLAGITGNRNRTETNAENILITDRQLNLLQDKMHLLNSTTKNNSDTIGSNVATINQHKLDIASNVIRIAKNRDTAEANMARIKALNATLIPKRVAFTALKTSDQGPWASGSTVSFEDVIMNDGGGYNPNGFFTAPHRGVYFFQWHTFSEPQPGPTLYYSSTYCVKNGVRLPRVGTLAGPIQQATSHSKHYYLSSQSVIVDLKVGETFDIRIQNENSMVTTGTNATSSFSGHMLYSN